MNYFLSRLEVFVYIALLFCASGKAEIHSKSRAGINYGLGLNPAVSRVIDGDSVIKLDQFHRISLTVEVPMYHYLSLGFAFDYTLAISPRHKNPVLDIAKDTSRISSSFLGASFIVTPQMPFTIGFVEAILYGSAIAGFGVSTPITFGTQPLSNYTYNNTSNIPTPFPIYFETTPTAGIDFYFLSLIGVGLGVGYRMLWVMHPLVHAENDPSLSKDNRFAIWYDVTSFYLMATLKLAF
jgi:hypothetical protein